MKLKINAGWINADQVRKEANDWDLAPKEELDNLMNEKISDEIIDNGKHVIVDLYVRHQKRGQILMQIANLDGYNKEGRFDDTNRIFVPPEKFFFEFQLKMLIIGNIDQIIKKDGRGKNNLIYGMVYTLSVRWIFSHKISSSIL